MKKILFVLLTLFVTNVVFANVELDSSFYGTVPYSSTITTDSIESEIKQGFAFGSSDDVSIFFGSEAKNFEVGLGFFAGIDVFTSIKIEDRTIDENSIGFNINFGAGPAFRYTLNNNLSLFARPGLGFNIRGFANDESEYTASFADVTFMFDLNAGGRYWFFNKTGFHLGLDFGFDLNCATGTGSVTNKIKALNTNMTKDYDVNFVAFKPYVGLAFNFGDRGIDR